jgi:small subunit ribosomal protein S10
MFKQIQITVRIKSFHPFYINRFVMLSQEEAKKFFVTKINNVFLPSKVERFTLLRSPHVDKKARDQFEKITHKRLLQMTLSNTNNNSLDFVHQLITVLQKLAVGVSLVYKFQIKK